MPACRGMPYFSRKRPAHFPIIENGNRAIIVFVTVCVKGKRPLLARPDIHQLLIESWSAATRWRVGKYVIMPDHVHLFATPATFEVEDIRGWSAYWKSIAARNWPRPDEMPVWQADVWDTQLRAGDRYSEKWEYVRANPARAGLVENPEEWPYRGELNEFRWHDR